MSDEARTAELTGRKLRTVKFKVREVEPGEVNDTSPQRYALELGDGRSVSTRTMTEADLWALHRTLDVALQGYELPVESKFLIP